jgi:prophage regulatory protein
MVTYKELKSIYGIPYSRTHVSRKETAGEFPRRLRLGNGPRSRCVWRKAEIEAWIAEKLAERDGSE